MSVVPFAILGAVVLMAVFGDHGLVRRHELRAKQVEVEAHNALVRQENAELRRQIRLLEQHEVGLRRAAAEELLMARPGSIIYRFGSKD
ncbi:MAG: septum formation initiator family protein [Proteobacteria bacterium]|nr:septum formation initiator family protein [Pseudomonadota bacterium]